MDAAATAIFRSRQWRPRRRRDIKRQRRRRGGPTCKRRICEGASASPPIIECSSLNMSQRRRVLLINSWNFEYTHSSVHCSPFSLHAEEPVNSSVWNSEPAAASLLFGVFRVPEETPTFPNKECSNEGHSLPFGRSLNFCPKKCQMFGRRRGFCRRPNLLQKLLPSA